MISFNLQIELGDVPERLRSPDDVSRALFSLANQVMGDSWDDLQSGRVTLNGDTVGGWRVEAPAE